MTDSAPAYEYGVMHVLTDSQGVREARDRADAERDVGNCQRDGQACYIVRRSTAWDRVPDGE